jgi:hypothetical protein
VSNASRADLQVLVECDISELILPVFSNCCVKRASKFSYYGDHRKPISSFTLGSKIQLCIYDKIKELLDTCDEVKLNLLVNECLGGEFPEQLTRVEFRLRRDALKDFGIDTMLDLLQRERALVEYLTFDWFRLLENEKVKGNETRQKLHSVWQQVIDLFKQYFPGVEGYRKPLDKRDRRQLRCTGESLIKQAVGCMATVAAVAKGAFENEKAAFSYCFDLFSRHMSRLFFRSLERVKELAIVRGVECPDAPDWRRDPRQACAAHAEADAVHSFRVLWDEEVQLQNFRHYAVAGCPF